MNVGLIGCGWITEKTYLPILSTMNDVEIIAVFDTNHEKVRQAQTHYLIQNSFGDIDAFLSSHIDAVIIATPNNTHTYYSNLALDAGKHVLYEKPVALSEKTHNIFLPDLVNCFRKAVLEFGEFVLLVGEVREVEVKWLRKSGIPRPGTWITNKSIAGGGALVDIGIHAIDVGLAFLPDKRIKCAKLIQKKSADVNQNSAEWNKTYESKVLCFDVEIDAQSDIIFVDNAILRCYVNWASDVNEDITAVKVTGTQGSESIDTLFGFSDNFAREDIVLTYIGTGGERRTATYPMKNNFAMDAFESTLRFFYVSGNGQASDILKPSDSIYVVDAIEKLYQSA